MRLKRLTSIALVICLTVTLGLGNMLTSQQALAEPDYPDCCGTEVAAVYAAREAKSTAQESLDQLESSVTTITAALTAQSAHVGALILTKAYWATEVTLSEVAYDTCMLIDPLDRCGVFLATLQNAQAMFRITSEDLDAAQTIENEMQIALSVTINQRDAAITTLQTAIALLAAADQAIIDCVENMDPECIEPS